MRGKPSPVIDGRKLCTRCDEWKPADREHFTPDSRGLGGLSSICKLCQNARNRERYAQRRATDPEWVESENRRKREAIRRDPRGNRAARLKWAYGITPEEYDALLEKQGGGCAVCGATECTDGRRLHVDHDHETGRVRGLLCNWCNLGVGAFRDDPELLARAIEYLGR